MYNLAEQKLLKTLMPGIRWISCMDVHPSGDHLIVGGYDRKLCWFDLELSDKPYKILRCVFRNPYIPLPTAMPPRFPCPEHASCGLLPFLYAEPGHRPFDGHLSTSIDLHT